MTVAARLEWGRGTPPPAFHAVDAAAAAPDLPGPDAQWGIAFVHERPVARLAVYVRHDLAGAPGDTGLIGHYAATDADAAIELLRDAASRLTGAGVRRVLGPMNGSTWGRYRFAVPDAASAASATSAPPFLGEPVNPPEYPAHFAAAGFHEADRYESRITRDIAAANPRAAAAEATARARGVRVTPLDLARFDDELRDLHELSLRSFAENLYYSPIGAEEFAAMYRPLRALLDPALVLLARDADASLIGYAFAYADPLSLEGGRPHRMILKTLAVDPDWRSIGLGALLVERLHAAARGKGLSSVIHALMHVANNSMKISAHTAELFRRYALYEHP
jgi:GNAT superfamily N-acetyltransferase